MKLTRRTFGAAIGSLAAIQLKYPAEAAEFNFKFATNVPDSHPTSVHTVEAARKLEQDSGGRMAIQVFTNNSLGNETAMVTQVQVNAVQLYTCNGAVLAQNVPMCGIESIPFAFGTYQQAFAAMDGPLGASVRAAIRKTGLHTFDKVWCSGFHHVINSVRPIVTPEDLKGLKLRVALAPIETAAFKGMDASPQPLSVTETYTGLQTHLLDGAIFPLVTVEALKLFEVQKYLSLTRHAFTSFTLIANNDAVQSLPKPLADAFDREINAAGLRQRADVVAAEDALQKTLAQQGMTVNTPQSAPFRAAVRKSGLYEQWRSQFGTTIWAQLERSAGTLA